MPGFSKPPFICHLFFLNKTSYKFWDLSPSPHYHVVCKYLRQYLDISFGVTTLLCVCVYALPPVGFFRLHDICDIRETFGSTIFCCEHFLGASVKFLHLYLRIYPTSPPKTKTTADRLLERKRCMFGIRRKDDIYWYRI